ncbi:Uncharacterised protein [Chlamydia trachomatis]|nr:Uncharacterised protein [Chlamydia trachomatis]
MRAEFFGNFSANFCRNIRITVTIGSNPASWLKKCRTQRWNLTSIIAQFPIVKTTIHIGNHFKKRVIKDVNNGIGFFNGSWFFKRNRRCSKERLNFLKHTTIIFGQRSSTKASALFEQRCNISNTRLNGLTACFGWVRRKYGVKFQTMEQLICLVFATFTHNFVIGGT